MSRHHDHHDSHENRLEILLGKLIKLIEILIKRGEPRIRSGVITRINNQRRSTMAEVITVGASAEYQVTWFDGPNGTGNPVAATAAAVWSSGSEANLTAVSSGLQTATVTGVAAGTGIDVSATDPTSGVVAAPLAFDIVAVVGAIVSGVITKVGAALRRR